MIGNSVKAIKGTKDEGVSKWFHEIDRSIKKRDIEKDRWESNEQFENLKQWDGKFGRDDEVTINKLGSFIRTRRSALAFNNPVAKFTPKSARGYESIPIPMPDGSVLNVTRSDLREKMVNQIIQEPLFGLSETIDRVIKAEVLAYGAAKTGYSPSFKTMVERDSKNEIPLLEDGTPDFSQFVLNPVTQMPVEDENGDLIKKNMVPVYDEWFLDWTPYKNMLIDPDGENDFMQHSWVGSEIIRDLDDVKADPLYKNTDDLEGELYEDESSIISGRADDEDTTKRVRLFELYDLVNDRTIVLVDGYGKYLMNKTTALGITHSPFEFMRTNEILGEFFQRPIASDLTPINTEYNLARRQQLVSMKKSNRKLLMKEGAVDTLNMTKLTSNVDMEIVVVKTDGPYGIEGAVAPLPVPSTDSSIYAGIQYINNDFNEVAGAPGESRGAATAKTATQVNVMQQYAGSRIDYDRKCLVRFLVRMLKKLNDSIDANMSTERAVQLVGPMGQAFTAMVNKDMIAGDYDISIDVQEMAPVDGMAEGSQFIQLLQVISANPWPYANEEVVRAIAEKFNIKDERFIKGLVEAAQMQIQMMQQQAMASQGGDPAQPNAGPPQDEAQAAAQMGAGMQVPSMGGGS